MSTLARRTQDHSFPSINKIVDIRGIQETQKEKINQENNLELTARVTFDLALKALNSGDTFLAYLLTMASDEAKSNMNKLRFQ
jgi:hypothetical protein